MSGGRWNYQSEEIKSRGAYVKDAFDLLGVFEHELDWGICHDTCIDCAKLRVAEALICFFDGNVGAAIALAKDSDQNQCPKCEARDKE